MATQTPRECDVCFNSISLSSNKIIECITCGINVHCKCYDLNDDLIDNDWCCDVCIFKQHHQDTPFKHKLNIKCTLCPNHNNNNNVLKQQNNGEWAHIFCLCWNKNMANNSHDTIQCIICNQQYGITQKCFYPTCNICYHPLCGKYEQYSQIICTKSTLRNKTIFIQFCNKHKNTNIYKLLQNEFEKEIENKNTNKVGPISIELKNKNKNFIHENTDNTDSDDNTSIDNDLQFQHNCNVNEILSLDQKLQKNDIALNKKEVIELLWHRSDKYHQSVTTNDYLRIAPHNYFNDPIFGNPIKGKSNFIHKKNIHSKNNKRKRYKKANKNKTNIHLERKENNEYNSRFSYRFKDGIQSQFHDIITTNNDHNNEHNEWTLDGIKKKLINENNNEHEHEYKSERETKQKSLNHLTNASVNNLPAPIDDTEISLIGHQLGLSLRHSPFAQFDGESDGHMLGENECESAECEWDGNASNYKVEMDPFGWRWVLKQTQITADIANISCPCLLCKYISNEYKKKRRIVSELALQNPLNIKEPKILESRPFNKQSINVLIKTKHGRVLTEYKPNCMDNCNENGNEQVIECKTIANEQHESEHNNILQPRMVNIMQQIAYQRWQTSRGSNIDNNNKVYKDEAASIYHIDEDMDNNNKADKKLNKPKPKRGRKRKRSNNNQECNGYSSPLKNKRRRKNDESEQESNMSLDSFRVLDANLANDLNNEITQELYQNVMSLYSVMRLNDDRKHMMRTQLRESVQLKEAVMLQTLHSEVVSHGMRHVCIWQQIRGHFIKGFSDKCGIFDNSPLPSSRRHSFATNTHNISGEYDENDVSVCCVCFDGTFVDKNPIIFCDHCNIGIHRYCYGLRKIPNENSEWLCIACKHMIGSKDNEPTLPSPQCCLCPIVGGALARTKQGGFAHISCAIWIQGIEIGDIRNMSPILNIPQIMQQQQNLFHQSKTNKNPQIISPQNKNKNCPITRSRRKQRKHKINDNQSNLTAISLMDYFCDSNLNKCAICKECAGCFIKCGSPNCVIFYHVFCAWFNGQFMKMYMDEGTEGSLQCVSYCTQHTPLELGGAQNRNFNKFKYLRRQGLTQNNITAQIHKRERILSSMSDKYQYLNIIRDTYLPLKCAVCFVDNGHEIISCSNCGICVHLQCYNIVRDCDVWCCDACECVREYAKAVKVPKLNKIKIDSRSNSSSVASGALYEESEVLMEGNIDSVQCVLCPRKGGALKLVDHRKWVHLCCVLYIDKCSFNAEGNGKIKGVAQLIKMQNKNKRNGLNITRKCYLCHCNEGCTIHCCHKDCNLYFHVLCGIFSGSLMDNEVERGVFCRKHSPILQIRGGGVHYVYENMKLLKLRKAYAEIQCVLYALKQRQFRNKCLMENVEKEIRNKLPAKVQLPSTPSSQLIVDDMEHNDNNIHSHKQEMNDIHQDVACDDLHRIVDDKYEQYADRNSKYRYKMALIDAFKRNLVQNDNESDSESGSDNDIYVPAINTLPTYTNECVSAIDELYNECVHPQNELFKNMNSIINGNINDFKYFDDGLAVNKLISFAKYANHAKSQIFNGHDMDRNDVDVDLDYNIASNQSKRELNVIDKEYLNQLEEAEKVSAEQEENDDGEAEGEEEEEAESECSSEDIIEIDSLSASKMRKCNLCGRDRGKWSISCWIKHLNSKHIYKCNHCKYSATKARYLKTHLIQHGR